MRRPSLAAALIATLTLAACSSSVPGTPNASGAPVATNAAAHRLSVNATLVRVIDGDTIDVHTNGRDEHVRLIGIDTPETVKPNTPIQCYGPEASAYTKSLLPHGTPLHLERDVDARDAYGRLLAYVYRADDGMFVNLDIIRQGYAHLFTYPPNVAHVDEFVAAAQAARAENRGLWAKCNG
jgi:micrococcal nuclease